MNLGLLNVSVFLLLSLVGVEASGRRGKGRAPERLPRAVVVADDSTSSFSSGASEGMEKSQIKDSRRVLNEFQESIALSIKVKCDALLEKLENVDSDIAADATLAAFAQDCNKALARRHAVVRKKLMEVYNDEAPDLSTQRRATTDFRKQLTKNTIAE